MRNGSLVKRLFDLRAFPPRGGRRPSRSLVGIAGSCVTVVGLLIVLFAFFLGGAAENRPSVSQPRSPVLARGAVVHTPPIPCAKRTIAAENALPGTDAWRVDHPVVQLGASTPIARPTPPDEGAFATPTPGA